MGDVVIRESVVEFGPSNRFVGVLTRPAGESSEPAEVAVVITNAGIIHRVGPHRLHVRLGRTFAEHGYPTLRYDLPGIGDSEGAGGEQVMQMKLAGTRAALDRLQRMGVARRFVIMGICSGGDHALVSSVMDPRVAGAVIIDPTTIFATRRHRLNRVVQRGSRIFVPRVLWRLVTGRYGLLKRMAGPQEPPMYGLPRAPAADDVAAHTQAAQALGTLAERGTRMLMIMTGHTREVFSYRGQILDAFPEVDGLRSILTVEHFPTAGHTFGSERDRGRLASTVLGWLPSIPRTPVPESQRSTAGT